MLTLAQTTSGTVSAILADYIGVLFVAMAVAFVATPINRWLATRNGLVDWPDLSRKNHLEPVAYMGGVAILIGWLGGIAYSYLMTVRGDSAGSAAAVNFPLPLVFGATVITLTGLVDDIYNISPRVKIGGQFLAAAAMALSSQSLGTKLVIDITQTIGVSIPWPVAYFLGAALLAIFVIGGCNSMNLLDGLDGLAAGVAAIACTGFLVIALYAAVQAPDGQIDPVRIVMCLAAIGALLGFLPYNFNPANIFMGDAGSLLVGYLCVSTILLFADSPHSGPKMVMAALIVFGLPIIDTALAIARRVLKSKPVSKGDTDHLHHQFLRTVQSLAMGPNISVKIAVLMLYIVAMAFAFLGCSVVFLRWRYTAMVFVTLLGFLWVGAYKSGRRRALMARMEALAPGHNDDPVDVDNRAQN